MSVQKDNVAGGGHERLTNLPTIRIKDPDYYQMDCGVCIEEGHEPDDGDPFNGVYVPVSFLVYATPDAAQFDLPEWMGEAYCEKHRPDTQKAHAGPFCPGCGDPMSDGDVSCGDCVDWNPRTVQKDQEGSS